MLISEDLKQKLSENIKAKLEKCENLGELLITLRETCSTWEEMREIIEGTYLTKQEREQILYAIDDLFPPEVEFYPKYPI